MGGGRPSRSVFASRLLLDALSLKKKKRHSDEPAVCLCARRGVSGVSRGLTFDVYGPLPKVTVRDIEPMLCNEASDCKLCGRRKLRFCF